MKKLAALASAISYLVLPLKAFAQTPSPRITIKTPEAGYASLGDFVNNFLTLAFAVALLVVLVMLIWGAFEWITSGGDKDAVAKARNRIINALIGLAVLAVAFALARLAGQFTGLNIMDIVVPTPPSGSPRPT